MTSQTECTNLVAIETSIPAPSEFEVSIINMQCTHLYIVSNTMNYVCTGNWSDGLHKIICSCYQSIQKCMSVKIQRTLTTRGPSYLKNCDHSHHHEAPLLVNSFLIHA